MDRNFLNVSVGAPPAMRCGSAFTQSTFMSDKEACEFNTVRSGNAYLTIVCGRNEVSGD